MNINKVITRIPRVAQNGQQINHLMLKSFFDLNRLGNRQSSGVLMDDLRSQFVYLGGSYEKFNGTLNSMMTNAGNSYGEYFQKDGDYIYLSRNNTDIILSYSRYFTKQISKAAT